MSMNNFMKKNSPCEGRSHTKVRRMTTIKQEEAHQSANIRVALYVCLCVLFWVVYLVKFLL